jgi:hypothetical protein
LKKKVAVRNGELKFKYENVVDILTHVPDIAVLHMVGITVLYNAHLSDTGLFNPVGHTRIVVHYKQAISKAIRKKGNRSSSLNASKNRFRGESDQ